MNPDYKIEYRIISRFSNLKKRNQISLVSLFFQILVNCFCRLFACAHCTDYSRCTCDHVSACKDSAFGGCAGFLVGNHSTSFVLLKASEPLKMIGLGEVPIAIITTSAGTRNSEPSTMTGLLLPDLSGSPSSISMHSTPVTLNFSSPRMRTGL